MTNTTEDILSYLRHRLPAYPFDEKIDPAFVEELVEDFQRVDILEETKAFRWYYDNEPVAKNRNVRLGLRRWILRSHNRQRR
jgi:hypothetical protein